MRIVGVQFWATHAYANSVATPWLYVQVSHHHAGFAPCKATLNPILSYLDVTNFGGTALPAGSLKILESAPDSVINFIRPISNVPIESAIVVKLQCPNKDKQAAKIRTKSQS